MEDQAEEICYKIQHGAEIRDIMEEHPKFCLYNLRKIEYYHKRHAELFPERKRLRTDDTMPDVSDGDA